ncbi:MAG TPA: FAD-dependent oxidoreductase, partial [Porticoccaceae bacterium]|nr:FAD-dependent oxidoreductase [Porticoccaceae bacterium]
AQVAVAGAGVAGRLLACRLLDAGARVSLVDENPASDARSCSFAAAGMLSPLAEIEQGELTI